MQILNPTICDVSGFSIYRARRLVKSAQDFRDSVV